jgi:hypothetical protein
MTWQIVSFLALRREETAAHAVPAPACDMLSKVFFSQTRTPIGAFQKEAEAHVVWEQVIAHTGQQLA